MATDDTTQEAIAVMIRQLGDASYERRTTATRKLCALGAQAVEQLREAAARLDNTEVALRARSILKILDQLPFVGVEVKLALSSTAIAWDEPVDLFVTVMNRSERPARVPFELDSARRAETSVDALQVGDMLDVADGLHVVRHDGETIELTVDDITDDPAVAEAVQQRVEGGPATVLQPGERRTLTVREFNRGWARYRLLDAGLYTIIMDYVPPWDDEVLAAEGVGRATSNAVTLRVAEGAPEAVSRKGTEASLQIRRDGASLVAELTNRSDQTMIVNRNFGSAVPFAQGQWICELDGTRREVSTIEKPRASWNDFDASQLIQLPPGQTFELGRIGVDDLRRRCAAARAADDAKPSSAYFVYTNSCNRSWQNRQGRALFGNPQAPSILQNPLPRRMLSARYTSGSLTLRQGG